jgi:hypothetical protein
VRKLTCRADQARGAKGVEHFRNSPSCIEEEPGNQGSIASFVNTLTNDENPDAIQRFDSRPRSSSQFSHIFIDQGGTS